MVLSEEIGYACEIQENISVEDIRKSYNDGIIIWINGSGESSDGKSGKYRCVLDYMGHVKYIEKQLSGATANQAMIMGAIDATKCVNKPVRLYLVSPTALGFANGFKGKGSNVALIQRLYEEIKERNCRLTEVQFLNSGDAIKKFVYSCNPDKSQAEMYDKQQNEKKQYYKEMIYKECLLKVERVLLKRNVDICIVDEIRKIKP